MIGVIRMVLSNRSNIPPCPGIACPESFTPILRLLKLSSKSPNVPNITTISENMNHCQIFKSGISNEKTNPEIKAPTAPPKNPSHDFFGEIRSNKRWRPNNDPTN